MTTFEFKTNFKCQGCVDKVAKELNTNTEIASWKADLTSPDKTLTVETSLCFTNTKNSRKSRL